MSLNFRVDHIRSPRAADWRVTGDGRELGAFPRRAAAVLHAIAEARASVGQDRGAVANIAVTGVDGAVTSIRVVSFANAGRGAAAGGVVGLATP